MNSFQKKIIVKKEQFQKITEIRVDQPNYALEVAKKRIRRDHFTADGYLNIVAADHPARGSLSAGNDALAMGDRHDLLARLVQTLQSDWVDGVLGSMDILEELLIIHGILNEEGRGFLDGKLLIGSLNRGGLPGSVWELDDPITGTDSKTCVEYGIDATKMLLRVDFGNRDSLKTIQYCAEGIRDMRTIDRPVFIEPLPVEKSGNAYKVVHDPDKLIQLISVSAALGDSSRNIWLKIPFTEHFERVTTSTTLPIVILGGGKSTSSEEFLSDIQKSMESGNQVRGTMIGRNILYPKDSDPLTMAESVGKIVHGNQVPAQ